MKFYNNQIDKLYLINGLARSGNHLFISWLLSSLDNEIYYLNNIKTRLFGLIGGKKDIDINIIYNYHSICSDNKYGSKFDKNIKKKLTKKKNVYNFLTKKKKIKILIFSMENKKFERLNVIEKLFTNANKIYKIITIRDILNLFSSRIKSEQILNFSNTKNKTWQYETDKLTILWWLNN